jgi:hypothetical protein
VNEISNLDAEVLVSSVVANNAEAFDAALRAANPLALGLIVSLEPACDQETSARRLAAYANQHAGSPHRY